MSKRIGPVSVYMLFFSMITYCSGPFAATDSTYRFDWLDEDKQVYVLQNRQYRKAGRLNLSAGAGLTPSGAFSDGFNFQGRASYFITENWGVEFLFSKNSHSENSLAKSVKSSGAIPFRQDITQYLGGLLQWSPFYAKINTFDRVMYFDWLLGLGFGSLEEENNKGQLENSDSSLALDSATHGPILISTTLLFYLNKSWNLRLDYLSLHYQAPSSLVGSSANQRYTASDLTLSLGLMF